MLKNVWSDKRVLPALGAVLSVGCLAAILGGTREVGYHFLWAVALAALYVLGLRFFALEDGRMRRCFGVLGFLFAGAQALGARLEIADRGGLDGLLLCTGAALGLTPAVGYLFSALYRGLFKLKRPGEERLSARGVFWIAFAAIFLCWMPVFLAYWPGISSYDVITQLGEILSGKLTNRNPLLHTLVMGAFYRAGIRMGDPRLGYSFFILMQMVIMAACFASVIRHLWKNGSPRCLCWGALALFALLPIHSMLAVSDTKDGFFVAFLALEVIRLDRLFRDPSLLKNKRFLVGFVGIGILMCMMRNNAFIGLVLGVVAVLIAFRGMERKRLCALFLVTLVCYFGVMNGLKLVCGASGGLATEFVSVQSQQMGRVYSLYHETEPDDCDEIKGYLPTVEEYTPYTADPLKTVAIVDKPYRMWGFLKLWGRIGLGHPMDYLDAWLLNTKGYWYLDDTTHAHIYGEGDGDRLGYLLSRSVEWLDLSIQSRFPALEGLYERLFTQNEYQRLPVVSLLFAPSLYLWLYAFLLAAARYRRDRRTTMLLTLVFGSFLPLLFGACVLIRYAYPFVACLPLMLGSLLSEKEQERRE